MTMLIRAGCVHTMTDLGTITADVLIEDGRVAAIAPDVTLPQDVCTLSAAGLHILPGLIDLQIPCEPPDELPLLHECRAAGVTTALLWPSSGPCRMLASDGVHPVSFHILSTSQPDAALRGALRAMHADGMRPVATADDEFVLRRLLNASEASGIPILLNLRCPCDGLEEVLLAAGCSVLISPGRGNPWAAAVRLDALGVPVALSMQYPALSLKHMILFAGLCVREGILPERALQLLTAAPADILQIPDKGRILPGNRADLVLYDGDPIRLTTSHVLTIQNGKICC